MHQAGLAAISERLRWRHGAALAALCATGATCLTSAASSPGAVVVGQLFVPANTCAGDTFLQTSVESGTSYTVPTYGAITSWSFWTSVENVPNLTLKVAHPNGAGSYTIVGESAAPSSAQHPNQINTYSADILVEPGDVIGIYTSGGATPFCGSSFQGAPGDSYVFAEGNWGTGTTTTYQSPVEARGKPPNALFPVSAVVSAPPSSSVPVHECANGTLVGTVEADFGTIPKGIHYIVDGGEEKFAKWSTSTAIATIKGVPVGTHTLEYWAEDKAGQLESARHTVSVFVVKQGPKVTITSDQNKSAYNRGEHGSVTIRASDPHGLYVEPATGAIDPSASHVPIETATAGFYPVVASATNNCGDVTKETFTYTVAPIDHKLRVTADAFAQHSKGARVSWVASDEGTTSFAIYKGTPGVRGGGGCRRPRKGASGGKPCVRYGEEPFAEFTHGAAAGSNSFRITSRVGGHTLAPGPYRLDATPVFDGIYGKTLHRPFEVMP